MKSLFASILIATLPVAALAQAPAQPAKPAAKPAAAKPAAKPAAKATVAKAAPAAKTAKAEAVERSAPLEEPDPRVKLNDMQLAIARTVHTGDIKCELGAKVSVKPMKRDGFFLVTHGVNRFVMHPVESRTGAIRLEDPVRGALWMQLSNKSMLLNQKVGQRLADECQSGDQLAVAESMKGKPPINILEPAPVPPQPGPEPTSDKSTGIK